jgi:uncharacterized glyoxalase superfamily protein PhnB
MHFQGLILHVEHADRAAAFYARAFGLTARFRAPDGSYVELGTDATTTLALATRAFAAKGIPGGTRPNTANEVPAGFNVTLRTEDVRAAFDRAVSAGAVAIQPPEKKPWGQVTALVRDCEGILVEIGTPWAPPRP